MSEENGDQAADGLRGVNPFELNCELEKESEVISAETFSDESELSPFELVSANQDFQHVIPDAGQPAELPDRKNIAVIKKGGESSPFVVSNEKPSPFSAHSTSRRLMSPRRLGELALPFEPLPLPSPGDQFKFPDQSQTFLGKALTLEQSQLLEERYKEAQEPLTCFWSEANQIPGVLLLRESVEEDEMMLLYLERLSLELGVEDNDTPWRILRGSVTTDWVGHRNELLLVRSSEKWSEDSELFLREWLQFYDLLVLKA